MHEPGRVEQDVDRADLLCERGDRGGVPHIEPRGVGDPVRRSRQRAVVDVGREHGRPLAREREGAGPANPGRGSGDEGALPLESVRHGYLRDDEWRPHQTARHGSGSVAAGPVLGPTDHIHAGMVRVDSFR